MLLQQAEACVTLTKAKCPPGRLMWATLFLVQLAAGCDRTPPEGSLVLARGTEYRLHVSVSSKPSLTPEREAALGPLQDSVTGTLTVDSIIRDSAFGHYNIDLLRLGLMANTISSQGPQFVAKIDQDSVFLLLNPEATDAGVYLTGHSQAGRIEGAWQVTQASGGGTFSLDPR
jgi:hypothetical protein